MNPSSELNPGPKPLVVTIIGVGGAGANVIELLSASERDGLSFALVHTNARVLEQASCPVKLLLGAKLLRGLGAGSDPDLARAAAEEEAAKLKSLCDGADLVFIAGGLGGGTATGVAPVLARVARESGALTLGCVALPFDFEGPRRVRQAQAGLQRLRGQADGVICLPNQKVSQLFDETTRATEVFNAANELWADGMRGLLRMLTRRGLINVDFADVAEALRGRHAESCFATAAAAGEMRSKEVVEKILTHPLLDGGKMLAEASALLVTLTGGPDLTIAEVNWVMEQLRRQPDNANFVMGASADEAFVGKLALTIIASKYGLAESTALGEASDETPAENADTPIETPFFGAVPTTRPLSRIIPPPPEFSLEKANQLLAQQSGKSSRARKAASKMKQGQLPLEIVAKGRFEKSEPTIHHGEDLDVPTYVRRGVKLN